MAKKESSTRIKEIISVIRKHNALTNFVRQKNPAQVREALEELGPTFIKIGQMLSTRPDLVSPAYINELRKLQDDVPIDSFQTVSSIYRKETGRTIEEDFAEFDRQPFASASIGQAHRARLKDGTEVVVKIQHPAVAELVAVDLNLLQKAVKLLRFTSESKVINLHQVFNELKTSLTNEINTKREAENGIRFYKLNNGDGIIQVPRVYPEYCAPKILVNESMPGKSIRDYINASPDKVEEHQYIARTLVKNFIKQVFEDHYFHADPHPGNILFYRLSPSDPAYSQSQTVRQESKKIGSVQTEFKQEEQLPPYRLVYLDFGMMGSLTPALAQGMANVVVALASKDYHNIGQAILAVCNRRGKVDELEFIHELGIFLRPYLNAGVADINFGKMLYEIVHLCQKNNLQVKAEVTMLIKAFSSLEGIVARLDPDLSLMDVARPFALKQIKKEFSLKQQVQDNLFVMLESAKALPQIPVKAERLLDTLNDGHGQFIVKHTGLNQALNKLERLGNRLMVTIILAAVILSSSLLVQGSAGHPYIAKIGIAGYIIAIVIILVLVLGAIRERFRKKRP